MKTGEKEKQRRAMREAAVIAPTVTVAQLKAKLAEMEAESVTKPVLAKFDKRAYQRELMRKRRSDDKARKALAS